MNLKPEELVKALRCTGSSEEMKRCEIRNGDILRCNECINGYIRQSADQIEHDQKEIAALREKQRWISVTEKTPEYDMPQLALNADGDALIANYAYGEWFDTWGQDVEVTHWMPLPELPKVDV